MFVLFEEVSIVLLVVSPQGRETVLVSILTRKLLSVSDSMRMVVVLLLSEMLLLISQRDLISKDSLSSILHINLLSFAE